MSLSDPQTRARLERLEAEARDHPRRHWLRLVALVAIGYAYPALLVLLCVGIVAALIAIAPMALAGWAVEVVVLYLVGVAIALALAVGLAQTFLIRIAAPEDPRLRPEEAPALRALINDLRSAHPTLPAIHHIHVNAMLNAAVVQRRRFALMGPNTNHLILGLPLLRAMRPEELRAVLAHEFVHLDRAHNRFNAWIYRVHQTWAALAKPLAKAGVLGSVVFGWFAKWYGPWLATDTLSLRRLHEYEADWGSVRIVGADQAARALIASNWAGYRLERMFWPALLREAGADPLPPADVLGRIAAFLGEEPPAESPRRFREYEMARRTPITSDHPALADRLMAIERLAFLDAPGGENQPLAAYPPLADSALVLLGDARRRASDVVNAGWKAQVIGRWRHEHATARRRGEAEAILAPRENTPAGAAWREIRDRAEYAPPEQAMAILREFLGRFPDHPDASYAVGALLLLQRDDRLAVPHIETAMRGDSDLIGAGLNLLLDYYRDAGRDDEAEPVRRRLEAFERSLRTARQERLTVSSRDRLAPHGLTPAEVERVRQVVRLYPQVNAAYLARKHVSLFADKPSYVLGVTRRGGMLRDERDKFLAEGLRGQVPLPCAVVVLTTLSPRLRSRLLAACPEPIFEG